MRVRGPAALFAILLLAGAAVLAKGSLGVVARFGPKSAELAVATFTDEKGARIGLVGIAADRRNSIALRGAEWDSFVDLCDKAIAAQGGAAWKLVGELTETQTEDISHLRVEAGPGAQFTIESPKGARVSARVSAGELPQVKAAALKVKAYLNEVAR